jgi:RimJ/RimL family protein N-acetyltransferase
MADSPRAGDPPTGADGSRTPGDPPETSDPLPVSDPAAPANSRAAPPAVDLDALAGTDVRLRELRESDLPQLCAWWADPRIVPYQIAGPPHLRPASSVAEMFRSRHTNEGMDCGFCIVTKDADELVGQAALFGISPKDRCATLGIFLGPQHQGRGFGIDATRTLVRYGFAELNLHRIELNVYSFNSPALATYGKVGFVEEGRRREAVYRSGAWHDEVKMALLRSEWKSLRSEWEGNQ